MAIDFEKRVREDYVVLWHDEYNGDDSVLHEAEAAARAVGGRLEEDQEGDFVLLEPLGEELSEGEIYALQEEAAAAGDEEQVMLCLEAIDGDVYAKLMCARAIKQAAEANTDGGVPVHPHGDMVVTYARVYLNTPVTVCGRHRYSEVEAVFGALGAVQHGAHEGRCEICRPRELD